MFCLPPSLGSSSSETRLRLGMTHPALRAPLPRGDLYLTVASYNSPLLGRGARRAGWVRSAVGDSARCSFIPLKPGGTGYMPAYAPRGARYFNTPRPGHSARPHPRHESGGAGNRLNIYAKRSMIILRTEILLVAESGFCVFLQPPKEVSKYPITLQLYYFHDRMAAGVLFPSQIRGQNRARLSHRGIPGIID